jgi:hypothetical protein
MSFRLQSMAYKVRKLAEAQGRDDILEALDNMPIPDDGISTREGRLFQREKEDQLLYRDRLEQREQIKEIERLAKEKGRQDILDALDPIKAQVDADIFDAEDISEEAIGTGIAITESLTLGIIGDEAAASIHSKVTGEDYDKSLSKMRRIEKEFAEDHRAIDMGIRIGAGLIPSVRLAKMAGVGTTAASGAARQAGITSAEIATYRFAEGEGGVKERLEGVADLASEPLAIGAVALTGGLGGVGGRTIGKDLELEAGLRAAVEAEEKKLRSLREGKGALSGSSVVGNAQLRADEMVLDFYNQMGRMPQGTEITNVYRNLSEEMEIPIGRIMQSEMKAGKMRGDLNYAKQSIDDVKGRLNQGVKFKSTDEALSSRSKYFGFRDFWEDKLESIVNVAKNRVSNEFGGSMQKMATRMAQNQQALDKVFSSPQVQSFGKVMQDDRSGRIKMELLNFSNTGVSKGGVPKVSAEERMEAFENFKSLLTKEQFEGFQLLQKLRLAQADDYRTFVYRELGDDPLYFPSQMLAETNRASVFVRRGMPRRAADENMKQIQRGKLESPSEALAYESPLVVMRDKLVSDDAVIQMHKAFKLQNNSNRLIKESAEKVPTVDQRNVAKVIKKRKKAVQMEIENGEAAFSQLRSGLKDAGASEGAIYAADDLMRSFVVRGIQAPNNWLANMRKAAYMGTIGNPYSAILNFGDSANTVVNFGADNTALAIREYFKRGGYTFGVEDVGLLQQATGEFIREGSKGWQKRFDRLSDLTFQSSGFRGADRAGKSLTLTTAVKRGQQKVLDGSIDAEYSWLFNRNEMARLKSDLINSRRTQRVKEFAAAELGKLQPSDMAQMPKWYIDHPNGRLLYMLRTFGIKQLQQIDRLVIEQVKQGNQREAIKNAIAYVTIVGGGNTLLNELRQPLKGEEFGDLDRAQTYFTDFFIGVATLNSQSKYAIEKAIEGDPKSFIGGFMPAPVDMVEDVSSDFFPLLVGEKDLEEAITEGKGILWAPWMRTVQPILEENL